MRFMLLFSIFRRSGLGWNIKPSCSMVHVKAAEVSFHGLFFVFFFVKKKINQNSFFPAIVYIKST